MARRFWVWFVELAKSLDQFGRRFLGFWGLVVRGNEAPSADETISSVLGRKAAEGKRWALVAEWVINPMFFRQVDANGRRNHCRRVIEHDEVGRLG